MLKSWSEEEERAESISEEFRHAMDLGGDPALARRVQRLVAEAERPVRRKAVVKQAEKLSCVVPRVAAASATLESKRKAMVKETRPLDVARERMKQQGYVCVYEGMRITHGYA